MSLVIHQSGIDAAISAKAEGFSGAQLKYVDLFNGSSKIKRLDLAGVQLIEPGRIYVAATDSSTSAYDVTKMQFITSTGALFATAQHDDGSVIQSKAEKSTLMLANQLNISSAPGTIAPSSDVSLYAPPATEDMLGAAEIATQTEVDAGTDDTRLVTSKKLKQWLLNRLSSSTTSSSTTTPANSKSVKTAMDRANLARAEGTRQATTGGKGQAEIATQTEANAGVDNERIITPKTLKSRLLSFARSATESARGFIEIATQSEVDRGTDHARAVTPKTLHQRLHNAFTPGPALNITSTSTSGAFTVRPGKNGQALITLHYSTRASYGGMGIVTFTVHCAGVSRSATSSINEYENRRSAADMSVSMVVNISGATTCSWSTTGTRENRNMNGCYIGL